VVGDRLSAMRAESSPAAAAGGSTSNCDVIHGNWSE
jgi:hypothetical protein